jgi:hypothetical protein
MSDIEQMSEALLQSWGAKTLEALRRQARAGATGVAFDAIRAAGGMRLVLAICVTKRVPIAMLRQAFPLVGGGAPEDWTKLTLLEITMRAAAGPGVVFKSLKDSSGGLSDAILIATEPRSIAILERIFRLPK